MWAWSGSHDSTSLWVLNANCSKTAKDTNFKFGRRVSRYSPDITLTNVSEKWAWLGSRDPVNIWALDAIVPKRLKNSEDTDFEFGRRVLRDSLDMMLTNVTEKWAWSHGHVTP